MTAAVIFVKGHNQEMQEMLCRAYAEDKGYKVVYVATDIEAIAYCNVLLVANPSRISRNEAKYHVILNELKKKGIEVESVEKGNYALL